MNEERFFFYYDKRKDAYTIYLLAGFLAYLPIIIIIAIFFFFNRQQLATHSWFSFFFSFFLLYPTFSSFLLAFFFFDIRIWTNLSLDTTTFFFLLSFFITFYLIIAIGYDGGIVLFQSKKMKFCYPLLFILMLFEAISTWNVVYKKGRGNYKDSLLNHLLTSSKASLGLS